MSFFEWLAEFIQQFIPPWEIVPKNYCAVRQRSIPLPAAFKHWADNDGRGRFLWVFRRPFYLFVMRLMPPEGVIIRDCGCGFVFKIPLIDLVTQVPVKFVSQDLMNVEVETRSGKVYDLSPVLWWKTTNPIKAVTEVDDFEDSLKNATLASILRWVGTLEDSLRVADLEAASAEILKTPSGSNVGTEWGCYAKAVSANSCAPPWEVKELWHRLSE
jgi:hypothetical protein